MSLLGAQFFKADPLFQLMMVAYFLAFVLYVLALVSREKGDWIYSVGRNLFSIAWILNAYAVVGRGIEAGRPPIKTSCESLIYFTFLFGLLSMLVDRFRKVRLLGAISLLVILLAMTLALLRLDIEISPLPPALRSAWFLPHVTFYFAAYGSITVAFVLGLLALLKPGGRSVNDGSFWHRALGSSKMNFETQMMAWIRAGFLLLTGGLITGGLWAKFAWSDYWAWDPKENWGLISWLAYAAVLHLANSHSLQGRKVVVLSLGAWILVLFTYFGTAKLPTRAQSIHLFTETSGQDVQSGTAGVNPKPH
jgi:cytochrome c-type biogenesis protein CcsB